MLLVVHVLTMCFCIEHCFATNACKESVETAIVVSSCPRTAEEWNDRSLKKNCSQIKHSCSSLEYHCVINTWINAFIEVCAPKRNIVGKVCAEYNYGGKTIQGHSKARCEDCPNLYISVRSFMHQRCYEYVKNYITSQDTTMLPPTLATADPSEPSLPSKDLDVIEIFLPSQNTFAKTTETPPELESNTIMIPTLSTLAVAVIVISLVLVYVTLRLRVLKRSKCDEDLNPSKNIPAYKNDLNFRRFQNPQKVKTDSGEPLLENMNRIQISYTL